MALQLETARIDPGITVVLVSGNMTFEESDALPAMVGALIERGVKRLILDLNDVQQIDSLGGVSLVRCFFAAREAKADVCVASPNRCVTQLFKSIQVDTLIQFFPTMTAAREHSLSHPRRERRRPSPRRVGLPSGSNPSAKGVSLNRERDRRVQRIRPCVHLPGVRKS